MTVNSMEIPLKLVSSIFHLKIIDKQSRNVMQSKGGQILQWLQDHSTSNHFFS